MSRGSRPWEAQSVVFYEVRRLWELQIPVSPGSWVRRLGKFEAWKLWIRGLEFESSDVWKLAREEGSRFAFRDSEVQGWPVARSTSDGSADNNIE